MKVQALYHATRCSASGHCFASQVAFLHGCFLCFMLSAPCLLITVAWVGFRSNFSPETGLRVLKSFRAGCFSDGVLPAKYSRAALVWAHRLFIFIWFKKSLYNGNAATREGKAICTWLLREILVAEVKWSQRHVVGTWWDCVASVEGSRWEFWAAGGDCAVKCISVQAVCEYWDGGRLLVLVFFLVCQSESKLLDSNSNQTVFRSSRR